ncbi:hypothetical protein N7U66_03605 [Lacinutrix neustonica]|uniref:Uncharacterized protein n=1 Tax=Lacinutrix neustonica TaxID=2980107 RepID=A0A9E8SE45_9FLAO|nr:hypothetical protein [Lacinutrix neustonica]WAC02766.1 hypothetical protein N7U66_03605 [Lacinutrix neustonica]
MASDKFDNELLPLLSDCSLFSVVFEQLKSTANDTDTITDMSTLILKFIYLVLNNN